MVKNPSLSILLLIATALCCCRASTTNTLVNNFEKSASYGNSIKEDNAIMKPPFSQLQASMKAAPLCLSILGNLNLFSTIRDINLVKDTGSAVPNYEHLPAPDSLRSSLSTLSNAAFWAFNTAHDAMHEINLQTEKVPGYLNDALYVLFTGTTLEVESSFPTLMSFIKDVADRCVDRSKDVEEKYKKVMLIAQDLNDAALRKQGYVAEADRENDRQLKISELEKEQKTKEKEDLDRRLKEANEEMEKRLKKFEEAEKNLEPDPWKAFGMGILGAMPQIFSGIQQEVTKKKGSGALGSIFDSIKLGLSGGLGAMNQETEKAEKERIAALEAQQQNPTGPRQPRKKVDTRSAYANKELTGEIRSIKQNIARGINQFFHRKNGTLNAATIQSQRGKGKGESAELILSKLRRSLTKINSGGGRGSNKQLSDKAIKIIGELESIVKSLKALSFKPENNGKRGKPEHEKFLKVRETLDDLITIDLPIIEKSLPFKKKGPEDPIDQTQTSESALKGAYAKLDIAEKQYEKALKTRELAMKEERELTKTINDLMTNLKNYEFTEAQLNEQLAVMAKCIKVMEKLKKEWSKLVQYFQHFARQVETTLGTPLKNFVKLGTKNYENKIYEQAANQVIKTVLYRMAYTTSIAAHNIHEESSAYLQLSTDLFMPAVSKLGELIALDPEEDKYEIKSKKKELDDQANKMVSKIDKILQEHEDDFRETIAARLKSLKEKFTVEVLDKLPDDIKAKAPAIQKKTKEAVKKSFANWS